MEQSYTANSLRVIKPNRFLVSRFRNIRWKPTDEKVDDAAVTATNPLTLNESVEPLLNQTNERANQFRDRYNK
jgi:hypothetical protein